MDYHTTLTALYVSTAECKYHTDKCIMCKYGGKPSLIAGQHDYNDMDDRHSMTGDVFTMSGGAISWLSQKQTTFVLSTAEAEYVHCLKFCYSRSHMVKTAAS